MKALSNVVSNVPLLQYFPQPRLCNFRTFKDQHDYRTYQGLENPREKIPALPSQDWNPGLIYILHTLLPCKTKQIAYVQQS